MKEGVEGDDEFLPRQWAGLFRSRWPAIDTACQGQQAAMHDILAPKLARDTLLFQPRRIDDHPFREGALKLV